MALLWQSILLPLSSLSPVNVSSDDGGWMDAPAAFTLPFTLSVHSGTISFRSIWGCYLEGGNRGGIEEWEGV